MKLTNGFCLSLLISALLTEGCSSDEKKPVKPTAATTKPALTQPFRYHKLIEVSPGQDYDILSWGRGSSAVGAFMILHSDSSAAKYTTTTGDLSGEIVDVYNSDMDLDGNPEILIQAKGKDTIYYSTIYAFEFSDGKAQKLDFPKLTRSFRKGYRGDDNFYTKDGILTREFPIYDGNGKDAKPTGQKRLLQYGLRGNEFTVKQLSKDPVATGSAKSAVSETPVKKTNSETKHSSSSKKSKKHKREEEKKPKKKRKKHHHSDDN